MTEHRLAFRVSREKALDTGELVWSAVPLDAPATGGVTGETLADLFEEAEAVKHFVLDLPRDATVTIEYVYDTEVVDAYREERP